METDICAPVGDYAMSCLGRERIFAHFSRTLQIPVALIRLNYAVEMRYGVLLDVARRVWSGEPVNLNMAMANVIWQADANAHSLLAFAHCAHPPFVVNVTGPETLSIRRVAEQFGQMFGKPPRFEGRGSDAGIVKQRPTVSPFVRLSHCTCAADHAMDCRLGTARRPYAQQTNAF